MTLSVGDVAPNFSKPSTDRDKFDLYEQLKNGPILLNFYIGDFGIRCTDYMTKMIESRDEFKRLGVRFVGINPDGLESHRIWRDRMGSDFEHVNDENKTVSKEYGAIVNAPDSMVNGFTNREFFLIGTDRKIKYIWRAATPKNLPDVKEILEGVKTGLKVK